MTVGELISILEDLDEDTQVRFASQPSWPMEYSISDEAASSEDGDVVYLSEGSQLGYLPGHVTKQLGWR